MSTKTIVSFAAFAVVAFSIAPLAGCSVDPQADEASLETASAELTKAAPSQAVDAGTATLRKSPSDTIVSTPSEGTACDICGILSCACANGECYECGLHVTAQGPSRP